MSFRALEDDLDIRMFFESGRPHLSNREKTALKTEIELLQNPKHLPFVAEEVAGGYMTSAGLATVRQRQDYIIAQLRKGLGSYGIDLLEMEIEDLLIQIDLIFYRSEAQDRPIESSNFLQTSRKK